MRWRATDSSPGSTSPPARQHRPRALQCRRVEFGTLLAQADTACFAARKRGNRVVAVEPGVTGVVQERSESMRWPCASAPRWNTITSDLLPTIAPLRVPQHDHCAISRSCCACSTRTRRVAATGAIRAGGRTFRPRRASRSARDLSHAALVRTPSGRRGARQPVLDNLTAASVEDETFLPSSSAVAAQCTAGAQAVFRTHRNHRIARPRPSPVADPVGAGAWVSLRARRFRHRFCSFGYLRSLDVDFFKIDGSFRARHRDVDAVVRDRAFDRDIGRVMRKQTIAECAESESVRQRLGGSGVDFHRLRDRDARTDRALLFGTMRRLA